jgi:hypothetical protein
VELPVCNIKPTHKTQCVTMYSFSLMYHKITDAPWNSLTRKGRQDVPHFQKWGNTSIYYTVPLLMVHSSSGSCEHFCCNLFLLPLVNIHLPN